MENTEAYQAEMARQQENDKRHTEIQKESNFLNTIFSLRAIALAMIMAEDAKEYGEKVLAIADEIDLDRAKKLVEKSEEK